MQKTIRHSSASWWARLRRMRWTDLRRERGSALILTILVILVLGMLGMTMAAFSETEERIAAVHRDEVQVLGTAQAGVRVAQQMLVDSGANALVPQLGTDYTGATDNARETSLNSIGIFRTLRGSINSRYTGAVVAGAPRLFAAPFIGNWTRTFGGARTAADNQHDIRIRCVDPASDGNHPVGVSCWLDQKINPMFSNPVNAAWNSNVGRITSITLYAPPQASGRQYAYATAVVTAEKRDSNNRVIASQTLESVLGPNSPAPAILSEGDMTIGSSSQFCGSNCESIHANGNVNIGNNTTVTGANPAVSATGTITGGTINPASSPNADRIEPPQINPWDLSYRPTTQQGLDRYYLLTSRTISAQWLDNDPNNNPAPYTCAQNQCEDYGLEYPVDAAGVRSTSAQARNTSSQGCLYKWMEKDAGGTLRRKWVLQQCVPNGGGITIGSHSQVIEYRPFQADTVLGPATQDSTLPTPKTIANDNAELPYNKAIVPIMWFAVKSALNPTGPADLIQNATFLVDGCFLFAANTGGGRTAASPAWAASVISVGSLDVGASASLEPALPNRIHLIAGRDIYIHSAFNNDLNTEVTCPTNVWSPEESRAAGIIAAHEQIKVDGSPIVLGVMIAENRVNFDNNRTSGSPFAVHDANVAGVTNGVITSNSTRHAYNCGLPPWPWPVQGPASILSLGRRED